MTEAIEHPTSARYRLTHTPTIPHDRWSFSRRHPARQDTQHDDEKSTAPGVSLITPRLPADVQQPCTAAVDHDDSTAVRQIVEDGLDRCPRQAKPGCVAALAGMAGEQPCDDPITHRAIENPFHTEQAPFQQIAQPTAPSRGENRYAPVILPTQADHPPIPLPDRGNNYSMTAQQEART
ncbi:hypothetical protein [Saccharopolyspora pogona]|uniref:hypothetical protein n=1 Tax=Saccharopolyspora pogona TaxID=333966 RepID=UPI001684C0E5|nr:hypothetical protein [Saccharopolyspora pogona]